MSITIASHASAAAPRALCVCNFETIIHIIITASINVAARDRQIVGYLSLPLVFYLISLWHDMLRGSGCVSKHNARIKLAVIAQLKYFKINTIHYTNLSVTKTL